MAEDFLKALDTSFQKGAGEYAKALNFMMVEADKDRLNEQQRNIQTISVEEIVVEPPVIETSKNVPGVEDVVKDGDER